jgi:hypothetical protein
LNSPKAILLDRVGIYFQAIVIVISVPCMACKTCGSVNEKKFGAEMAIHSLGLKNIDTPVVWVFAELTLCLDCGSAEFAVPEAELRGLAKGDASASG